MIPIVSNLQQRQQKIQEKRKATPWRDFVMEICSWFPFCLYKNNGLITPYSQEIKRIGGVVLPDEFEETRNSIKIDEEGSLFERLIGGLRSAAIAGVKVVGKNENAQYSYITLGAKNAYLSIVVVDSENILYTYNSFLSTNIYSSILVQKSDHVCFSRIVGNSSYIFYSSNIESSSNIWFSSNIIGCTECINCENLNNKSYCIDNQQYEKDEYFQKKQEIFLLKNQYQDKYVTNMLRNGANIGDNISGSFNKLCEEVEQGYMNYQLKSGKNIAFCNATDVLESAIDCCSIGGLKSDNIYACMGVGYSCSHVYCSAECSPNCHNVYYSYLMDSCSFCLGCIGLKNKHFCIFNKQYTKEERYEEVDKIFGQMETDGTLGQFFPATMNPFYFNDTAAYLIDPSFTKEEVTAKGYLRRDEPIKVDIPPGVQTVKTSELGQFERWIASSPADAPGGRPYEQGRGAEEKAQQHRHIDDEILKRVILDEQGNAYRIIPMELEFLRKYELPLPRKHWLDRMKENFRIQ